MNHTDGKIICPRIGVNKSMPLSYLWACVEQNRFYSIAFQNGIEQNGMEQNGFCVPSAAKRGVRVPPVLIGGYPLFCLGGIPVSCLVCDKGYPLSCPGWGTPPPRQDLEQDTPWKGPKTMLCRDWEGTWDQRLGCPPLVDRQTENITSRRM